MRGTGLRSLCHLDAPSALNTALPVSVSQLLKARDQARRHIEVALLGIMAERCPMKAQTEPIISVRDAGNLFVDRDQLRQEIEWANDQIGFQPIADATPEMAQEQMRAEGIRAEDNLFSRDIIRARYPDECGEEDK